MLKAPKTFTHLQRQFYLENARMLTIIDNNNCHRVALGFIICNLNKITKKALENRKKESSETLEQNQ